MKINRKTQGWNAAAASFAYGFGRFAQLGYKLVGLDQLVAGPYPDNFPSCVTFCVAKMQNTLLLANSLEQLKIRFLPVGSEQGCHARLDDWAA